MPASDKVNVTDLYRLSFECIEDQHQRNKIVSIGVYSRVLRQLEFEGLIAATAILCLMPANAQQSAQNDGLHGTCGMVMASPDNMAFIIDSRLTLTTDIGSTRSCSASIEPGCKAVLIRKDVLVGVTGVITDPTANLDAVKETRELILALPKVLEAGDLDTFALNWLRTVANHYYGTTTAKLPPEGSQVSMLIVATRVHGFPYVMHVPLDFHAATGFGLDKDAMLFTNSYPEIFYAGSCRDYITTHSLLRATPPNIEDPAMKWRIDRIGSRRATAKSIADMVGILKDLENEFTNQGEATGRCYIGPPYDVATWAKGEDGWTTHFKRICQQKPAAVSKRSFPKEGF